jgi:RecJ-like exonuclease
MNNESASSTTSTIRMTLLALAAVLLIAVGAVAAVRAWSKSRATSIATIVANAEQYAGDTVRVAGTITSVLHTPLHYTLYTLADNTARILVLAPSAAPEPIEGKHVRVTGAVHSAPSMLGLMSIKPVITEIHRQ